MKNLVTLLSLILLSAFSFGQSLDRQVIGATGGSFANSTIILSHTVGELAVASFSNSSLAVIQGFQQNSDNSTSIRENTISLDVKAYPNPTTDYLEVEINSKESLLLSVEVRDQLGRQMEVAIKDIKVDGVTRASINLSHLSTGNYIITLINKGQPLGTIKIIKN